MAPSLGGRKNFSPTKMTILSEKNPILAAQISDDLFLVIDQVFRIFTDFPDLYFVKCPTWLFPRKKNTFFTFFTLSHTSDNTASQNIGGTNAWAVSPGGGTVPPVLPRFPPLLTP